MRRSISTVLTGLLVVRRISYFKDERYHPLERNPTLTLTHDEVVKRYRGFEGEPWPQSTNLSGITLHQGLASLGQYGLVLDYFNDLKSNSYYVDLLCLQLLKTSKHTEPHADFVFSGYDFGFYSSEFNYYSVLFHEVLYGFHQDMRECALSLNKNLLLPTLEAAEKLAGVRSQLVEQGVDLEGDDDGEGFVPIAIHSFKAT